MFEYRHAPSRVAFASDSIWRIAGKSFWRTFFPWSICGRYCKCLSDVDKETRFLGFRMPALGEWHTVLIGFVTAICTSILLGWLTVYFCDDHLLIPVVPLGAGPAASNGTGAAVLQHEYNPTDPEDLVYRRVVSTHHSDLARLSFPQVLVGWGG